MTKIFIPRIRTEFSAAVYKLSSYDNDVCLNVETYDELLEVLTNALKSALFEIPEVKELPRQYFEELTHSDIESLKECLGPQHSLYTWSDIDYAKGRRHNSDYNFSIWRKTGHRIDIFYHQSDDEYTISETPLPDQLYQTLAKNKH